MYKRIFLLLSILTITCLEGRTWRKKAPCQCFCAFKGDLRDKEKQDKPFIATLTNSKGKTFDICLCAPRDLEHLRQNPALIDLISEDIIKGANCCDNQ